MASLFDKLRPAGVAPLKRHRQIIHTSDGSDERRQRPRESTQPHLQQKVTLAVERPRPTTTGTQKRRLAPARSSPNMNRPSPALRDSSQKPVSQQLLSVPHTQERSVSRSPRPAKLESSDEESSEDERASKRSKLASGSSSPQVVMVDSNRRILHPLSFRSKDPVTREPLQRCKFIHAEEIANTKLPGWSRRKEFKNTDLERVGLNYPGTPDQERYPLVESNDPDEFKPLADILESMEYVARYLLPPSVGAKVHSELSGTMVFRMRSGLKNDDYKKFLENLKAYNQLVRESRRDGTFKRRIAAMSSIPFGLVEHILGQSYARTVALEVDSLKEYAAFTSEVYGELLPKLTTKMFKEAGLTSDKVFVDLGSGTGNVVLHAALECGCESWGCEKMDRPAKLAERQRKEFIARCRMWGVNHGPVHLEHDTFLENRNIAEVIKRADVLLVNNFAFEAVLNQKLLDMFLDLKEGAIIFSLKPFVPANHVITARNAESPINRLRMVEKSYYSREVSWTDSGGKYYIHTVDSSMLREFFEKQDRRQRSAS